MRRSAAGRWNAPGTREAVISRGFASRRDVAVGDTVDLELAAGTVEYEIVGLVDDHGVAVYTDRSVLAGDAGAPGMGNVVWSLDDTPSIALPATVDVQTRAEVLDRRGGRARRHRHDLRGDRRHRRRCGRAGGRVLDDRQPLRTPPRVRRTPGDRRPTPSTPRVC